MKTIILSILAICVVGGVNAQKVKFGIKGGLNIANVSMSSDSGVTETTKGRSSFHIGGLAEIMFAKKFAFQPELLYTSVGFKSDVNDIDISGDVTAKTNYLAVPLMVKYFLNKGFSLEAGPQIAFLLSNKWDVNASQPGQSVSATIDWKQYTSSTDFGINLGASYQLKNNMFFSLRETIGITNINSLPGDNTKMNNNVFQISAGYMFK